MPSLPLLRDPWNRLLGAAALGCGLMLTTTTGGADRVRFAIGIVGFICLLRSFATPFSRNVSATAR